MIMILANRIFVSILQSLWQRCRLFLKFNLIFLVQLKIFTYSRSVAVHTVQLSKKCAQRCFY